MAESIRYDVTEYPGSNYYRGHYYFTHERFVNNLAQILKKEWFR